MNDYERRVLDCAKFHTDISRAAKLASDGYLSEYFSYTTMLPASAGPTQSIIPIQADSDFALVYVSMALFNTNVNVFIEGNIVNFQITDTGQGQELFSSPTIGTLAAGGPGPVLQGTYAGIPYMLPVPRIIARNTNVKIDVATSTPFPVYVTLTGTRVAYRGR